MKLCIFVTTTTHYSCMSLVRSNMLLNNEAGCTVNIKSGVSMMNFHIYPYLSPRIWKFALHPMATSNGNNSGIFTIQYNTIMWFIERYLRSVQER